MGNALYILSIGRAGAPSPAELVEAQRRLLSQAQRRSTARAPYLYTLVSALFLKTLWDYSEYNSTISPYLLHGSGVLRTLARNRSKDRSVQIRPVDTRILPRNRRPSCKARSTVICVTGFAEGKSAIITSRHPLSFILTSPLLIANFIHRASIIKTGRVVSPVQVNRSPQNHPPINPAFDSNGLADTKTLQLLSKKAL